MSKLKSLEELFAGRHFDRDVIVGITNVHACDSIP
jgi:hypothetical protein